jgi:hypothetical protein
MNARRTRQAKGRPHRRVLLVGFPPLTLGGLEAALRHVAEVVCVPFPGTAFDRAAEEFDPDVVVVDVTYLDESVVRPLIAQRLHSGGPLVAYVSDGKGGTVDDLRLNTSWSLEDSSVTGLVALATGSPLSLVAEQ